MAKSLRMGPAPLFMTAQQAAKGKRDSCEASGVEVPGAAKASGAVKKFDRKFAPVACEQPPRTQFVTPETLKQATAAAFASLR